MEMSRRPSVSANALSLLSLWLSFLRSFSSIFFSSVLIVIEHIWAHNLLILLLLLSCLRLVSHNKGIDVSQNSHIG
jgi:hypothetical protein